MRKYLRDVKGKSLIWCINLVAGLAIFFFGYDQGMMGGVNTSPDYVRVMGLGYSTYEGPSEGWVATITEPTRQGGIVSIYYFGTLLGCLAAGIIGDKIGRIKTMWIGSVWVLVGASLQCSAQNIAWMLCARVINGIGTGFLNAVVPVWTAEVATHTSRGATIAMEFTLNIFGVVVAYWLEFGMGFIGDGNTEVRWRFPIAFQVLPLLVFMVVVPFMPESPRWLIKAGRNEEARHILYRLRWKEETDSDVQMAQAEYDDIVGIVDLEKKHAGQNTYFSMFFGRHSGDLHIARRVQLNIWLQIVQEWAGIAAITVYAPTLFSEAGYSARKSEWLSGLNDITYCLSTLFAIYTIDRWGRRVGLWWGAVAQGICLLLAGGFGRLLKDHPEKAAEYGAAAAFFIFAYTAVFGATWLTIPWVYPTETFPLEVRAKGMAWGVVGWSIGNGWLTLMNPIMFSAIAENTFYIFAAVNFLSIPLVWAFYPETANRTLEEMDLLFASKSPFVWEMEKNFAKLKAENQGVSHMAHVGEHHRADEQMEVAGKV
ncbi:general substrate transporter [Stereum hirsutum FP-91666 SS1]|uniref:general substrate transporter n=1 Tax=Stereum hirsutum (strain FP-91666) TaxID=721885 RepID=UPI000444A5ED|nr:general substrate transporter [Stereum hirsutum FP-91666 SS1]EIM84202.1 general substrate transporter [Stereum hirsutum FP-91666 SS1]